MCGRFTLKTAPDQWGQLLLPLIDNSVVATNWSARYNIAPTQSIIALVQDAATGAIVADYFRWGLVPSWSKDLAIGSRMINARAETVAEKPSFKQPLVKRRCAIVADGYYEWRPEANRKQPYWIRRPNHAVFAMAGIWEANTKATEHAIRTCTIITTGASPAISAVHDRMPVAILGQALQSWLDPQLLPEQIQSLLQPAPNDFFEAIPVTSRVNNARFDGPECLEPHAQNSPSEQDR